MTGGQYTQPEVSRYDENGLMTDEDDILPNLVTGRWTHSCSWFINDDKKMVWYNINPCLKSGIVEILGLSCSRRCVITDWTSEKTEWC